MTNHNRTDGCRVTLPMPTPAQQWAQTADVRIVWEDDWDVGSHIRYFGTDVYDREPETCEWCAVYLGREVLASLGCIDEATDDYRKEIESELLEEAYSYLLNQLAKL